ncbi:hypothetical protein HDU84_005588 [Entophlyctis sp. JEL0112]|nr:hypothetical protein HDU84_005588 [Entophlyctis sp. JEL0112]
MSLSIASALEALSSRADGAEACVMDLSIRIAQIEAASENASAKGLAKSQLFNKKTGILAALKLNREALPTKAKAAAFDLIADLVRKGYVSKEHAIDVQVRRELIVLARHKCHAQLEMSAVKRNAVAALVALVECSLLDAQTVEAMTKRFIQAYVQVKCAILELYGVLVRYYPESFTIDKQDPSQLKRRFLNTMNTCIKSANPDMELLAGSVLGLSNYLHAFEVTPAESTGIFTVIKLMIIPLENQTRYSVPKAGMVFIRDHAEKFRAQFCSDKQSIYFLYDCLKKMQAHTNRDISKLGFSASSAFLRQVSQCLVLRSLESSNTEIEIFWMFVKDFVDAINAQGSSHSDFSYAVRGLGMFAAPCKVLLSNKELNELQQILTGKLSYLASWSQDAKFAHISAFINAFTLIAKEVNNLDGSFLNAIGEGVVDFDDDKFSKNAGILSNSSREIFRRTPSRTPKIVYIRPIKDLLIISCVKDDENFDANVLVIEAREPLWKVYLTFWGTLFSADANLPSSDDIREFHEALYDGMMAAILEFPDNLNFSVREANSEANQNEEANINGAVNEFPLDSSKIVAETPADFAIFVNFVSLCETLLPMLALNLFEKWITVAGQKFVAYSRAHPVVSGFYKLMASILVIAEKLKFFEIIADYQMDLDTSPLMSEDQSAAHHLFSEYISDTLLRMRQFKDDLLVSCLKMVLACPVQIVSVTRLCGPIVQALKLGLVYTPLAIVSLDALEHWISSRSAIDQKDLKNVFALVLPAFNDYLMLELEDDATQQQESSRSSKRVTKRGGKERTKHLKIHGFDNQEMDVETISNLRKVQIRIVKFLGKIGQDNRLLFDTSANESMLVWDPERNLKFPLPFKEAIFDLSLDDMLPRIAELAEFSPDRKAKIAANELLHALTMFMIGKSQMNRPEKESRSPYHKTYIKLFPVFLRLAVDLDRVTRELFQPMVMQLIHWFTKNSKYENPETMALLQSCFDSVSSTNGPKSIYRRQIPQLATADLQSLIQWLFEEVGSKELEYSYKCIELFDKFVSKTTGNSDVLDPIFHSTEIFGVLAKFVFEPALLGFDLGKQEAKEEISVRIVEFLGVFKKSLGKEIRTKMFAELAQFLLDSGHDLRKINEDSHFVTAKAQQMVRGLSAVHKCELLSELLSQQSVTLKSYFERVLENALSLSHGPNLLRKRLAEEMIMECLNSAEMGCWCFQQLLKACYADRKILQNLSSVINLAIVKNWATLKEELPPAGEPSFAALMMDNFFRWLTNWKIKHQHEFEAFLAKLISNSDLCKATVSVYRRNGDDPLLKFWRNILFQSSSAAKDGLTELFWEDFFIVFSSKSSLGTLNELFDFLPYVICPSKTLKIEDCLRSIISEKFPLASKNVEEYSEQFGDYRLAMSRLIFSMGQAANSILLEKCLIIHLCRDPKHPFNSQFIESLSKKVSNISAKLFLELAEEGFRLSIETRIAPENRINVARTLLIPVLQFGQLQHVTDFYAAKVQEIMAVLASSASENDSEIKDTFVNKSVCFLLMELAYKRIPSQHLHSSSGKILCAFVAPKSGEKELTVSLIKAGVDFKKKQRSDDVSISPFRLLANQCAFNSVAACLLSTQNTTKTDIFNSYLFVEKPLLWENIIDITNLIFIRSELDFPLPRLAVKDFTEHLISRNPVKYLSTQFLADSSLSQMKSLFKRDSGVSPLKPSTVSSSFDPSAPGPQYLSTFAYGSEQTNFEELDLDLINENICMKAFLSVILRLPSARDDPEMPSWMKSLFSKIEKPETHINIRLFILVAAYSEINIESKSTIRNNLQIVRVLVENWKHLGVAPTDVIFDHLNAKWDGSSKAGKYQNLTGVYIFQVFVANNICPYDPRSLSDRIFSENDFYNLMGTMLAEAKSKELYSPLAECFGELLKFLGKSSSGSLWAATVNEICRKRSTSDKKAFVTIVNRISVNYPLILKAQYKMLLSLFHSLDLEQKAKALEAILCWADEIPDLFTEILGLDVDSILFSGDEELQTYFLSIMAVLAPSLTPSQVEMFHTKTVELFVEHPSDRCRAAFFAMSHKLFETNNFASFNPVLKNSIRFSLLKGLTDSDEGIKSSLLEFFNSKVFSSNTIFERFIEILRTWYIPDIEDSFLKCTMHFLMDACKLTPMFEQKVYDRGLPEARFNDRDIVVDLSWERSSSMLPLFAATQQDRALSMPDVGSVLRMTQELVWTPTQDISAKDARSRFSLSVSEFEDFNKSSPRPLADRRFVSQKFSKINKSSTRGPLRRNYAAKRETSSFAYETERKKVESRNVEKFKKLATQRNVKIYRKYREGELPDIEISYRDIIEPLQSLAIRDNDVARQLLTLIIVKMGSHSAELKPEVVAEGIHFVFKSSTMMTPSVVGCLLDIMLQNTDAIQFSDPALISNVASRSSNFELGSLVVEHGIQNGLFGKESKRMKSLTRNLKRSPEEWVNLAKLFKDLKNYEVYESIYQSHISSSNITKEAINAEMLGNYEVAKQKYIEGLNGENLEINDCEPTLWTVRRLECMNKLGEWSLLASCVVEDLEEQVEAVWDDAKRDPYLSLFLRSHLKLFDGRITSDGTFSPWTSSDENPVKAFLDSARKDTRKLSLLENSNLFDITTYSLFFLKDFDLTRHYVDQSWQSFITSFSEINTNLSIPREEKLMTLQPIFELDEFLSFAKDLKSQAFDDINTGKLFREWQSRYPSSVDSISIWDDVIIGRKRMIEMAIDFIDTESKFSPEFANEFKTLCSSNDLLYSRKMAKAAASQKLFDVADRWLETATPEAGFFDPEFMAQYYKLQLMKCEHEREFFKRFEIVSNLARHMDYYKKSIRNTSNLMQMKFMLLEIRLLSQLGSSSESLKANDSFFESVASSKAITKFANGKKLESKQDLYTFFFGRSKTNMQLLHSFDLPPAPFQKGLLELGVFVDKCLKTIESDASLNLPVDLQREPAKIVLYSVLKAMNIGSIKAIEFFPRLLQLLMQHPHLNEEFQKHSLECPTWMFMKWLPQLTALLDKPSGIAVLPVIMRIANQYPNALRFPFTISCEQYTFSSFGSENEKMVEKIRRIIQSDAYDRLALELRRLEDPVHIYKDLCDRVESLLSSSLPNKRSALKQAFEDFKLICFDTRRAGDIVRKFAEKHSSKISGIFGGGEKLDDKKLKELQSYREKFGTEAESKPGKNLVKSFSTWLDQYQIGNFDDSELLEVPGQYTGLREPYPADHVKIANFDPNVLVMSSMRRPKKIVMIGTDEKEYPWLVKGGEDLRLDQRIEQMFGVMNELISRNPFCSRNRVNIVTYKVIPMSTSLGLIEWVDGTKPLKACFADNPAFDKKFNEAMSLFGEFIQKHGKSGQSFVASYEPYLSTATAKNVVANMQSIWSKNRDSYLRQFFIKMAVSAPAFFHIRAEFANSLAALNICSYLLGIGDRHLDNFLVDLKSGKIIGIDFGHAFGSATEVLPVPELVPFRLTDQMQKFLLPLGVESLIVPPMANVLAAIREGKDRLLNSLNIFVNEPLVEWRKFAANQIKKQGDIGKLEEMIAEDFQGKARFPWGKDITADELAIGHEKRKFFKAMRAALMGDSTINARAQVGRICETPKEQVDCLVDLAMDPNVLGRAWVGWSPFM